MNSIIKKPSAWIPIAMSLAVLVTMLIAIAISGPPMRQPDEGVGAHLFQIWLVLEVLLMAFFAMTWLPKKSSQALQILMLQVLAVLLPMSIVFFFNL